MPAPPAPARLTLRSGARVALEQRPHAASAALVLRLAGGTREEAPHEAGLTHLLEHLLLRRTARSEPGALAARIAALGGAVNAETAREHLALAGQAPAAQAPALAALLADCLCAPAFAVQDLAPEWGVLAAERTLAARAPAHDALLRLAWPEHPLGRPLDAAGPAPPAPAVLAALHARLAAGARLSVAVVGAFDAQAVVAALAPLAELPAGAAPAWGAPPRFVPGRYGEASVARAAELWWALPCDAFEPARAGACALAAVVLEHALTAALRAPGLAYACAVWPELYSDAGLIVARVAAPAGAAQACLAAVEDCLERLAGPGPEGAQIARAHRALRARAALLRDDLPARAAALASPLPQALGEDARAPGRLVPGAWLRLIA